MGLELINTSFSFLSEPAVANKVYFGDEISQGTKKCQRIVFEALRGLPNEADYYIRAKKPGSHPSPFTRHRWVRVQKEDGEIVNLNKNSLRKRLQISKADLRELMGSNGVIQEEDLQEKLRAFVIKGKLERLKGLQDNLENKDLADLRVIEKDVKDLREGLSRYNVSQDEIDVAFPREVLSGAISGKLEEVIIQFQNDIDRVCASDDLVEREGQLRALDVSIIDLANQFPENEGAFGQIQRKVQKELFTIRALKSTGRFQHEFAVACKEEVIERKSQRLRSLQSNIFALQEQMEKFGVVRAELTDLRGEVDRERHRLGFEDADQTVASLEEKVNQVLRKTTDFQEAVEALCEIDLKLNQLVSRLADDGLIGNEMQGAVELQEKIEKYATNLTAHVFGGLQSRIKEARALTDSQERKNQLRSCQVDVMRFLKVVTPGGRAPFSPLLLKGARQLQVSTLDLPYEFEQEMLRKMNEVDLVTDAKSPKVRLAANILGDPRFRGASLAIWPDGEKGGTLEGSLVPFALNEFRLALQEFQEMLPKGSEEGLKLDRLLGEYQMMHISSILEYTEALANSPEEEEVAREIAVGTLREEVQRVMRREKESVAWTVGFKGHFVPMRIERIEDTENLAISLFNLGDGAPFMQSQTEQGRFVNEVRLGDVKGALSGRIECTPQFIEERLEELCQAIVRVRRGSLEDYKQFLQRFRPEGAAKESVHESVIVQKGQLMGNCSCRGQLAMIRKAFLRLGLSGEQFKQFKALLEKRQLIQLEALLSEEGRWIEAPNSGKEFSVEDVRNTCWTKHFNLSPQGFLRALNRGETIVALPIPSGYVLSNGFLSPETMLTLDRLVQDKERAVFTSSSGKDSHAQYYQIPDLYSTLSIEKRDSSFFLTNRGMKKVSLEYAGDQQEGLEPGESIEVTSDLKAVLASPKWKMHFTSEVDIPA